MTSNRTGSSTLPLVIPEATALLEACEELRDLRRQYAAEQARIIECRDERLAAWHAALGTAAPAKARAGDTVRRMLLELPGWTEDDLKLVGVSPATVRVVLDRAQRQAA